MQSTLHHPLVGNGQDWSSNHAAGVRSLLLTPTRSEHIPPLPSPQRTLHHRLISNLEPGCHRSSVITLVSSAIGTGVLALPYSVKEMGLVLGFLSIAVAGVGCFLGLLIIARGIKASRLHSFAALLGLVGNRATKAAVDVFIALNALGCCISYFVFLGDFLPSALASLNFPPQYTNRSLLLVISLILMWPFCFQKKLSTLRHLSIVPLLSLGFTGVAMLVSSGGDLIHDEYVKPATWYPPHNIWNVFKGFNVCVFSFMQHINICPVVQEMTTPSDRRVWKTVRRAVCVESALYVLVTAVAIATFGMNTKQNCLQNYPKSSSLFIVCRLLLALSLIINVPLNMVPAVNSTIAVISSIQSSRHFHLRPREVHAAKASTKIAAECVDNPSEPSTIVQESDTEQLNRGSSDSCVSSAVHSPILPCEHPDYATQVLQSATGGVGTSYPIASTSPVRITYQNSDDEFVSLPSGQCTSSASAVSFISSSSPNEANSNTSAHSTHGLSPNNHANGAGLNDKRVRSYSANEPKSDSPQACNFPLSSAPLPVNATHFTNPNGHLGNASNPQDSCSRSSNSATFNSITREEASCLGVPYPSSHGHESVAIRMVISTFGLFLSIFTALVTDRVADVISLVGGLFATTLMFAFPALIHMKMLIYPSFTTVNTYVRTTAAFLIVCSIVSYLAVFVVLGQTLHLLPV